MRQCVRGWAFFRQCDDMSDALPHQEPVVLRTFWVATPSQQAINHPRKVVGFRHGRHSILIRINIVWTCAFLIGGCIRIRCLHGWLNEQQMLSSEFENQFYERCLNNKILSFNIIIYVYIILYRTLLIRLFQCKLGWYRELEKWNSRQWESHIYIKARNVFVYQLLIRNKVFNNLYLNNYT